MSLLCPFKVGINKKGINKKLHSCNKQWTYINANKPTKGSKPKMRKRKLSCVNCREALKQKWHNKWS
jgi:hypothetical protein